MKELKLKSKVAAMMLAAMQATMGVLPALANTITFTAAQPGKPLYLEGHLPLERINGVLLHNGLAQFQGNVIEIDAVPDWMFDPQAVLSGVVVNAQTQSEGTASTISGLAFFLKGEWLSALGPKRTRDMIDTTDGATLRGQIGAATSDGLEIILEDGGRRNVTFAEIKDITSPRAFRFTIPTSSIKILPADNSMEGEANKITISPNMFRGYVMARRALEPRSLLPGTEGQVKKSTIALMLTTDIATFLAIPIGCSLVCASPQARNLRLIREWQNQSFGLRSAAGLPQSGIPAGVDLGAPSGLIP